MQVLFGIDGVLCAVIALALPESLGLLRVAGFSAEEAAQGRADAWGASEFHTFRSSLRRLRFSVLDGLQP